MHCVRPPPCTRTSVTSYLTSMRLSQPESVLWMDANVYLEFSRAEIQVQQPHGRDLPPWRGAQSVRSELMNVGGNKKVVETCPLQEQNCFSLEQLKMEITHWGLKFYGAERELGGRTFICRSVFCFLKLIHFGGGSYHVGILALSYPGMLTPSLVVPWLLILQGVSVTQAINPSGRILFCIDEIHSF